MTVQSEFVEEILMTPNWKRNVPEDSGGKSRLTDFLTEEEETRR